MPRGYELEDFLTPRDVSEGREPTSEPSSRDQVQLPTEKSDGKSPCRILHLRPRGGCFEAPAGAGSA